MTKTTVPKLQGDELEAASYFFGCSNLAIMSENELIGIVGQNKDNFARIRATLHSKLGSLAETDEMFEGMLDEVKSFRKSLTSKERAYWNTEWTKALQGTRR